MQIVNKNQMRTYVGMGRTSFKTFLRSRREQLRELGVEPYDRRLNPAAVQYLLQELGYL